MTNLKLFFFRLFRKCHIKTKYILILASLLILSVFSILFVNLLTPKDPLLIHSILEVLNDPELLEDYKKTHHYLDDMFYIPAEDEDQIVDSIAYSFVWQTVGVSLYDNGGTMNRLYYNVEPEMWYMFSESPNKGQFLKAHFNRTYEYEDNVI